MCARGRDGGEAEIEMEERKEWWWGRGGGGGGGALTDNVAEEEETSALGRKEGLTGETVWDERDWQEVKERKRDERGEWSRTDTSLHPVAGFISN